MQKCESCGNEYARLFKVEMDGETHAFDSFECAINALAPRCKHCQTRIIGHGVEVGPLIYCCAQCAKHDGVEGLTDHID